MRFDDAFFRVLVKANYGNDSSRNYGQEEILQLECLLALWNSVLEMFSSQTNSMILFASNKKASHDHFE